MTDYYDPKYLRGAIRKSTPSTHFFRNRLFTDEVHFPAETVSFEFMGVKSRLAPYCSDRVAGGMLERDGYEVRTYRTPLVKAKRVITNDTAAMKLLGESPYNSGMTPEDRAAYLAARDVIELQESIWRREEFMCARALQDGKLAIKGVGINDVVDYGFDGIEATESGDKWVANYDLLGKLTKSASVLRQSGNNPDMIVLGTEAASAFVSNKGIQRVMDMRNVDMGLVKPGELEDGVQYMGRIAAPGIYADIYAYDAYYHDDETDTAMPIIDPKTAMLISSRANNAMLYGAVTYIDGKTGDYVTSMASQVPYTDYQVEPAMKCIYMASRPLPMPKDLQSWCVLSEVV